MVAVNVVFFRSPAKPCHVFKRRRNSHFHPCNGNINKAVVIPRCNGNLRSNCSIPPHCISDLQPESVQCGIYSAGEYGNRVFLLCYGICIKLVFSFILPCVIKHKQAITKSCVIIRCRTEKIALGTLPLNDQFLPVRFIADQLSVRFIKNSDKTIPGQDGCFFLSPAVRTFRQLCRLCFRQNRMQLKLLRSNCMSGFQHSVAFLQHDRQIQKKLCTREQILILKCVWDIYIPCSWLVCQSIHARNVQFPGIQNSLLQNLLISFQDPSEIIFLSNIRKQKPVFDG